MVNNEVPHDDSSELPSANPKIPPSTDSLLALSILPGYFQAMKSLFFPTQLPSCAPFVSLGDKKTILSSADTFIYPSLVPGKEPTYFLIYHPIHTSTSDHIRYPSFFSLLNHVWIPVIFHHKYLALRQVMFSDHFQVSCNMITPQKF